MAIGQSGDGGQWSVEMSDECIQLQYIPTRQEVMFVRKQRGISIPKGGICGARKKQGCTSYPDSSASLTLR